MKVTASRGETVNDLLYRIHGRDDDDLQEEFYRLNPSFHYHHLEGGRDYEVPNKKEAKVKQISSEVFRWA